MRHRHIRFARLVAVLHHAALGVFCLGSRVRFGPSFSLCGRFEFWMCCLRVAGDEGRVQALDLRVPKADWRALQL